MKDIFTDPSRKAVPKNLNECITPDDITKRLWNWYRIIEIIGVVVFWIIILYGIFYASDKAENSHLEPSLKFKVLVLPILVRTAICAFIEYISFKLTTLLIGTLASFVQNNNITTNLKIFKTYKEISAFVVTDAHNSDNSNTAEEL